MEFLYIKALHIVFVVTWFSGMFYLGRLFIYNREARDKDEPERSILFHQFQIMIRRLILGICWPSAVFTWIFGIWLFSFYQDAVPLWLWIKLGLVFLLTLYQFTLQKLYVGQGKGIFRHSSQQLRVWNEVPTVFLIAIVFLVVVKQGISLVYGLVGLLAFIALLMSGIRMYKNIREKELKG